MSGCHAVRVVVPARDEEELLPRCLAALGEAARRLRRDRPGVDVEVVVVLDRCRDGSERVARSVPGTRVLVANAGTVGRARALGAAVALRSCPEPAARVWLATTDADSEVPPGWLVEHLDLADRGADLVVGTVEPDDLGPDLLRRWHADHRLGPDHPHVHGANLGIRGDAYLAAGGFGPLPVDEDRELVDRVSGAGRVVVRTDRGRVRTSGRTAGRAPGGFATYLGRLTAIHGQNEARPAAGAAGRAGSCR